MKDFIGLIDFRLKYMATKEPKKIVKKITKKAAPKTAKVKAEKKPKIEKPKKVAAPKVVEKEVTPMIAVQEKVDTVDKAVKTEKLEKYFYAVGRRKTSVAQVRLFENEKATEADLLINGKKMKEYFPVASMQSNLLSPLRTVGMLGKFRMTVLVRGGGVTGQVEAVRLGIARALVKYDEKLKKSLKDVGLMTRDSREVERKKPGLKKARRAPQWAKR